jgi:hypothetical protein
MVAGFGFDRTHGGGTPPQLGLNPDAARKRGQIYFSLRKINLSPFTASEEKFARRRDEKKIDPVTGKRRLYRVTPPGVLA